MELISIATKNQFFKLKGNFYKQIDGVAVGSPLGYRAPFVGSDMKPSIGPFSFTVLGVIEQVEDIESLKPHKACGPNGIPSWFLKENAKELVSCWQLSTKPLSTLGGSRLNGNLLM